MALQKSVILVSFSKGLDTKDDDKQIPIGTMTVAENIIMTTGQSFQKRNGTKSLGKTYLATDVAAGGTISAGKSMANFKNELLTMDGTNLFSRNESTNTVTKKGRLESAYITQSNIVRNANQQVSPDSAVSTAGTQCFVWIDQTTKGVNYSIVDITTGQTVVNNREFFNSYTSPNYLNPRVVYLASAQAYFIFVCLNTQIMWGKIPDNNLNSVGITGVTPIAITAGSPYDASIVNSNIYIASNKLDNTTWMTRLQDNGTTTTYSSIQVIASPTDALGVFGSPIFLKLALHTVGGNVISLADIFLDLSFVNLISPITDPIVTSVQAVTGVMMGPALSSFSVFYSIPSANSYNYSTYCSTGSPSNNIMTRSIGLHGKAFLQSGAAYCVAVHQSVYQNTYFVLSADGYISGKISYGVAGGIPNTSWLLSNVNTMTDGSLQLATLQKELLTVVHGVQFTPTGVNSVNLKWNDIDNSFSHAEIGNNLIIGGGYPQMYDGAVVTEHNFHLFPEDLSVTSFPTGGALSPGAYEYQATYEWMDNQGQIHRSAPSIPVTASTVIGTNPTNRVDVTFQFSGSSFVGQTTIGSPNILCALETTPINLTTGCRIYGSANIPDGAIVTDIKLNTPIGYSATVVINKNATGVWGGLGFGDAINFTYGNYLRLSNPSFSPNTTLLVNNQEKLFVFGISTVGSPILNVSNVAGLSVGLTCTYSYGIFGANATILSIDTINNTVTMSGNATYSSVNPVALQFTGLFYGDFATGTSTILNCSPAAIAYANTHKTITSANLTATATIQFVLGTTITFTGAVGIVGLNKPFEVWFMGNETLQLGQRITDNKTPSVFTGSPYVLSTSIDGSKNVYVVIDTVPISSPFILTDIQVFNTFAAKVTTPTLRLTSKKNVAVTLYRSIVDNISVFYKIGSVVNDLTIDSVNLSDFASDTDLAGGPGVQNAASQLYTTGGVIENSAGPACTAFTTYQNRLVMVDSTNPLSLWYSKQVVPGTPVEFTQEFTANVDPRGGPVTSLMAMDSKLIIFKENLIFLLDGVGPAATGTQNDFTDPQLISSNCGCIDPKSTILYLDGVIFKSAKGLYKLNRGMNVSYIGSNVEAFNPYIITSTILIPDLNQIRFTLDSGTSEVIHYNYYYDLWTIFTNMNAVDSCIYNGVFNYLDPTGTVHQETPRVFNDDGAFISLHLTTGWMSFAGLQGFQRVYKVLLLGEYIGAHNLQVQLAYDFNPNFVQTVQVDPSVLLGVPFGNDAWFGSTNFFGGDWPTYQWRFFTQYQKSESIMVDVRDTASSPVGEGMNLSALAFEVGMKVGAWKVAAAKSKG